MRAYMLANRPRIAPAAAVRPIPAPRIAADVATDAAANRPDSAFAAAISAPSLLIARRACGRTRLAWPVPVPAAADAASACALVSGPIGTAYCAPWRTGPNGTGYAPVVGDAPAGP